MFFIQYYDLQLCCNEDGIPSTINAVKIQILTALIINGRVTSAKFIQNFASQ